MKFPTFKNKYFSLEIKEDILYVDYKEDLIITLPIAKEIVTERIKFQLQENYDSISMIGFLNIKYANKKAREYLATEGAQRLSAAAFIAEKMVSKTLLQIFLTVEKPDIPMQVFDDKKNAVAWIQSIINK